MLPFPGELTRRISPPSSREISRLIASPSPVPPYFRLVLPSACWNASKMICCLSGGMPMPVSLTEIASTAAARFSSSFSGFQPPRTGSIVRRTWPCCVNLNALDSRFLMTCWSRFVSVKTALGSALSSSMTKSTPLDSATCRNVRST